MLLFIDGFDHYTTEFSEKWDSVSGPTTNAVGGRRGSGAMVLAAGTYVSKDVTPVASLVCGIAYKTATFPTLESIFEFIDTATVQVSVKVNTSGGLEAYRGATLLGTAVGAVTTGAYYYIEAKALIHDSAGTIEIHVNGASVLSVAGADTRETAAAQITSVKVCGATIDVYYDDFYLLDTTGATNNDFLGDSRIDTIRPVSDGTYTDFTAESGVLLYAMVDDPATRTSDYIYGDTALEQVSFQFGNITSVSGTIKGVQVVDVSKKMAADPAHASIQHLARSGVTDLHGDAVALTTTDATHTTIVEVNPATSIAWTEAGINSAEFGLRMS